MTGRADVIDVPTTYCRRQSTGSSSSRRSSCFRRLVRRRPCRRRPTAFDHDRPSSTTDRMGVALPARVGSSGRRLSFGERCRAVPVVGVDRLVEQNGASPRRRTTGDGDDPSDSCNGLSTGRPGRRTGRKLRPESTRLATRRPPCTQKQHFACISSALRSVVEATTWRRSVDFCRQIQHRPTGTGYALPYYVRRRRHVNVPHIANLESANANAYANAIVYVNCRIHDVDHLNCRFWDSQKPNLIRLWQTITPYKPQLCQP